jgi:flagellar motility protein MotE (MotC chaperone)
MRKKITAVVSALVFCAVIAAQEPVMDIDKNRHPNLAEAQRLVIEANQKIAAAQKDNRYDMKGHAEKARQLLAEVNQELKAAAEAANASMRK